MTQRVKALPASIPTASLCLLTNTLRLLQHRDAIVEAKIQHLRVGHALANVGVVIEEVLQTIPEVMVSQPQLDRMALHVSNHLHVVEVRSVDFRDFVRERPQLLQETLHAAHAHSTHGGLLVDSNSTYEWHAELVRTLRLIEDDAIRVDQGRSEEHTSELQSHS